MISHRGHREYLPRDYSVSEPPKFGVRDIRSGEDHSTFDSLADAYTLMDRLNSASGSPQRYAVGLSRHYRDAAEARMRD